MSALADACDHFQAAVGAAHYILHFPRQGIASVGLGHHKTIRYQQGGYSVESSAGVEYLPAGGEPLTVVRSLLSPEYPSFWLISPDISQGAADSDTPLIFCVQAESEVHFRNSETDIERAVSLKAAPLDGWQTQSDELFIERLAQATRVLADYPEGKMIVTRPYQKSVGRRDPLALFRGFAATEPTAACNHFLRLGPDTWSLGCSPENVFEVTQQRRLLCDVVAGTRGIASDPVRDAKWLDELRSDPKELREHSLALERYQRQLATLIEADSLTIDQKQQVLKLGCVRHLYSKISGELRRDFSWLDVLGCSLPSLKSYPEVLRAYTDITGKLERFYGGVVGCVAAGGRQAAFYLNLRAALVDSGVIFTQGGVGVIAESEPAKELLEVKNKLRGLMGAVSRWERDDRGVV